MAEMATYVLFMVHTDTDTDTDDDDDDNDDNILIFYSIDFVSTLRWYVFVGIKTKIMVIGEVNLEEPVRVASPTRINLEEPVRVASPTRINLEEPISSGYPAQTG